MKKTFILLLVAGSISLSSAASLKVNLGTDAPGSDGWINVATGHTSQTGGQSNNYKLIDSLKKDGGGASSSVSLGSLDGRDISLTMFYKSNASSNSGYYDVTNSSRSLNSLFSDQVAQSAIAGKCNGVPTRYTGLQFTLSGLAANTTYHLYVLGNSGWSTNLTNMQLSGGVKDVSGSLLSGYEGSGTVSGAAFTGNQTAPGVGMAWSFTTDEAGSMTLTYERTGGQNVYADINLNGFVLSTAPVPEPATASLGVIGLAALLIRRRRIRG